MTKPTGFSHFRCTEILHFLQVWDWSPTRTTPMQKTPIHLQTFPEWNLRLQLLTEVTYLGNGIHSNRGSWMDRMRFWANQTLSSALQNSLKQGFTPKDIPGNFYTEEKNRGVLYWQLSPVCYSVQSLAGTKCSRQLQVCFYHQQMFLKQSSKSTTHIDFVIFR